MCEKLLLLLWVFFVIIIKALYTQVFTEIRYFCLWFSLLLLLIQEIFYKFGQCKTFLLQLRSLLKFHRTKCGKKLNLCHSHPHNRIPPPGTKNRVTNPGLIFSGRFSVLDATSEVPTGIWSGNDGDLGAFDQCLQIREDDQIAGTVFGKYCLGKTTTEFLKTDNVSDKVSKLSARSNGNTIRRIPRIRNIQGGACQDCNCILLDGLKTTIHRKVLTFVNISIFEREVIYV